MTLSKREKNLLGLLTFVIIIGSYMNFLIFPKVDTIKEKKYALKQKAIELNSLQQAKSTGKLTKAEEQLKNEIDSIEEAIPSGIKIPGAYLEVLSIVEKTGVQQESLNIQEVSVEGASSTESGEDEEMTQDVQEDAEQLLGIPIVHKIRGTYEEIEAYIDSIQKCSRKIDIIEYEIIHLKDDKNNHKLSASFLLKAYGFAKPGQNYSQFVDYEFLGDDYGKANPFQPHPLTQDDEVTDIVEEQAGEEDEESQQSEVQEE